MGPQKKKFKSDPSQRHSDLEEMMTEIKNKIDSYIHTEEEAREMTACLETLYSYSNVYDDDRDDGDDGDGNVTKGYEKFTAILKYIEQGKMLVKMLGSGRRQGELYQGQYSLHSLMVTPVADLGSKSKEIVHQLLAPGVISLLNYFFILPPSSSYSDFYIPNCLYLIKLLMKFELYWVIVYLKFQPLSRKQVESIIIRVCFDKINFMGLQTLTTAITGCFRYVFYNPDSLKALSLEWGNYHTVTSYTSMKIADNTDLLDESKMGNLLYNISLAESKGRQCDGVSFMSSLMEHCFCCRSPNEIDNINEFRLKLEEKSCAFLLMACIFPGYISDILMDGTLKDKLIDSIIRLVSSLSLCDSDSSRVNTEKEVSLIPKNVAYFFALILGNCEKETAFMLVEFLFHLEKSVLEEVSTKYPSCDHSISKYVCAVKTSFFGLLHEICLSRLSFAGSDLNDCSFSGVDPEKYNFPIAMSYLITSLQSFGVVDVVISWVKRLQTTWEENQNQNQDQDQQKPHSSANYDYSYYFEENMKKLKSPTSSQTAYAFLEIIGFVNNPHFAGEILASVFFEAQSFSDLWIFLSLRKHWELFFLEKPTDVFLSLVFKRIVPLSHERIYFCLRNLLLLCQLVRNDQFFFAKTICNSFSHIFLIAKLCLLSSPTHENVQRYHKKDKNKSIYEEGNDSNNNNIVDSNENESAFAMKNGLIGNFVSCFVKGNKMETSFWFLSIPRLCLQLLDWSISVAIPCSFVIDIIPNILTSALLLFFKVLLMKTTMNPLSGSLDDIPNGDFVASLDAQVNFLHKKVICLLQTCLFSLKISKNIILGRFFPKICDCIFDFLFSNRSVNLFSADCRFLDLDLAIHRSSFGGFQNCVNDIFANAFEDSFSHSSSSASSPFALVGDDCFGVKRFRPEIKTGSKKLCDDSFSSVESLKNISLIAAILHGSIISSNSQKTEFDFSFIRDKCDTLNTIICHYYDRSLFHMRGTLASNNTEFFNCQKFLSEAPFFFPFLEMIAQLDPVSFYCRCFDLIKRIMSFLISRYTWESKQGGHEINSSKKTRTKTKKDTPHYILSVRLMLLLVKIQWIPTEMFCCQIFEDISPKDVSSLLAEVLLFLNSYPPDYNNYNNNISINNSDNNNNRIFGELSYFLRPVRDRKFLPKDLSPDSSFVLLLKRIIMNDITYLKEYWMFFFGK